MNNTVPQVILIGNGINRAFSCDSWKEVLNAIKTRDLDVNALKAPMPLQAVLVTDNKVNTAVTRYKDKFFGRTLPADEIEIVKSILDAGFDEILTTNYSYELEADLSDGSIPDEKRVERMARFKRYKERQAEETRYLMHTYNLRSDGAVTNRIWHIHGEARKPDSVIIGHYFYGNLLNHMQQIAARNYDKAWAAGERECLSWVDSFIFGDVYIIGFGFDFSEFDLWWLINRKQREKEICSRTHVYWFEPEITKTDGEIDEKRELLKSMGVECRNAGFTARSYDGIDFREFYRSAIEEIRILNKTRLCRRKQPVIEI